MSQQKVNIVYTRPVENFGPLDPHLVTLIESVSPRIRVCDIAELVCAEGKGDLVAHRKVNKILAEADILFGFPPPADLLHRSPGLTWIQDPLVGVEMFLNPEFVASRVILTNARGIHDQVAELALMFALMLAKQSPVSTQRQYDRKWKRFTPGVLHSQTMGILGLGNIGMKIARLAKAFHMRVIATEIRPIKKPSYVDEILPAADLPRLLERSDFVVIAIPLTPETSNLIGLKEFQTMKPSACLINVARGGIIDEPNLVQALKEGWIAGAGLDVFVMEPLPTQSQLWGFPNVIITPHCAGLREDYDLLVTKLFCKNLWRFLKGKELLNIVDKIKGY
jgi:D-2-hydroxyacid dehydrogenase (NADP+)